MQLVCSYCKNQYETKYKPKGKNNYCSKSHANLSNPRRYLQGVCKSCKLPCASKLTYCKNGCYEKSLKNRGMSLSQRKASANLSVANFHRKSKQKSIDYLGGKCIKCGYNRCNAAMQFHHRDPTQKSFTISGKSISWDKLKPELDKCNLLCANCHAEVGVGFD